MLAIAVYVQSSSYPAEKGTEWEKEVQLTTSPSYLVVKGRRAHPVTVRFTSIGASSFTFTLSAIHSIILFNWIRFDVFPPILIDNFLCCFVLSISYFDRWRMQT